MSGVIGGRNACAEPGAQIHQLVLMDDEDACDPDQRMGATSNASHRRIDGLACIFTQSNVCLCACRILSNNTEIIVVTRWYAEDCMRLPMLKNLAEIKGRLLTAIVSLRS